MLKSEKSREGYIDAIKGWSILGVTMAHAGFLGNDLIATLGVRGPQMFFVISAYLMIGSYERFVSTKSNFGFKQELYWIIKRFIRLIPLWYIAVILNYVMGWSSAYWLGTQEKITVLNLLSHLFFVHGFFPYYANSILGVEWYIGDMAILIIVLPLLCKMIKKLTTAAAWWLGSAVVSKLLMTVFLKFDPLPMADAEIWKNYITNFWFWTQFPVMLTGMVLYRCINQDDSEIKQPAGKKEAYLLFAFGIVMLLVGTKIWSCDMCIVFGLAFALLFASQILFDMRLINNPVMRLFGKYSYGIYIFQFLIIPFVDNRIHVKTGNEVVNEIFRMILILLLLLGSSIVLTRFVERPVVGFLTRLLDKSRLRGE